MLQAHADGDQVAPEGDGGVPEMVVGGGPGGIGPDEGDDRAGDEGDAARGFGCGEAGEGAEEAVDDGGGVVGGHLRILGGLGLGRYGWGVMYKSLLTK